MAPPPLFAFTLTIVIGVCVTVFPLAGGLAIMTTIDMTLIRVDWKSYW